MKRRTLLSLSTVVLMLGGCATKEIPLFERNGRFSFVSFSPSGKREALNGRFSLWRTPASLNLNLMTPLNGIFARIEVTPRGAVLQTARDERSFSAPTAEELMMRATGMSIPVEALEQWLTMTDDQIAEYDWSVRVLKRRSDGMPGTIRASSAESAVSITLIMDED